MQKVNYPTVTAKREELNSTFYQCLKKANESEINRLLSGISHNNQRLTFRSLVTLEFSDLVRLIPQMHRLSASKEYMENEKRRNEFDELFDYRANQTRIAAFFMKQDSLNLNVCHYCGMEYINAFSDLGDYIDGVDFLNRATIHDLQQIKGIGEKTATKISVRKALSAFRTIDEAGLRPSIATQLRNFKPETTHNHFTLDHVFPQDSHRFLSLCLYNFVPSCFSCNSKFKKHKRFSQSAIEYISPTSERYSLPDDFNFKLLYSNEAQKINNTSDFTLHGEVLANSPYVNEYLSIFKLTGRYTFHKKQILHLIQQKIKYPDTRIRELSLATGLPTIEIKRLVFGRELFEDSTPNPPFIKFKRDIAKDIGIL